MANIQRDQVIKKEGMTDRIKSLKEITRNKDGVESLKCVQRKVIKHLGESSFKEVEKSKVKLEEIRDGDGA